MSHEQHMATHVFNADPCMQCHVCFSLTLVTVVSVGNTHKQAHKHAVTVLSGQDGLQDMTKLILHWLVMSWQTALGVSPRAKMLSLGIHYVL